MDLKGKQVKTGKAFEYAIAMQYFLFLQEAGLNVCIEENNAFIVARNFFNEFSDTEKNKFENAARNTINTMIKIEPGLTSQKNDSDTLQISLNDDSAGIQGDVRDVIFKREYESWEIGFSAKNNNDAVKHSRLGRALDFGNVWLNAPCSENYWVEIKPIFDYLDYCANNQMTWNDLGKDKREKIYMPLLNAFKNELIRIDRENNNIPEKLINYLIGCRPFYKIIKDDAHNLVVVKAFNTKGRLNSSYNSVKSAYSTPKINLPQRIVEFDFKANSETTLIMILDGGWEISFRLHNASTFVERSLKFDIKLLGNPPILFSQYIFQ